MNMESGSDEHSQLQLTSSQGFPRLGGGQCVCTGGILIKLLDLVLEIL